MGYTPATTRAIAKYGVDTCKAAYSYSQQGYGARSIWQECVSGLTNTRSADAAINAGREIASVPDVPAPCTGCTVPGCECGLIRGDVTHGYLVTWEVLPGQYRDVFFAGEAYANRAAERAMVAGYPVWMRRAQACDYTGVLVDGCEHCHAIEFERMSANPSRTLDRAMMHAESESARRILDAAIADVQGECAHWVPRILARMEKAIPALACAVCASTLIGNEQLGKRCNACLDAATAQGWFLADDSERGLEIQRYDAAGKFANDDDARAFVESLAAADPSSHAAYCLKLIANARPLFVSAWSAARASYDATHGAGAFDALSSIDYGTAKLSRNQAVREYIASL